MGALLALVAAALQWRHGIAGLDALQVTVDVAVAVTCIVLATGRFAPSRQAPGAGLLLLGLSVQRIGRSAEGHEVPPAGSAVLAVAGLALVLTGTYLVWRERPRVTR